MNYNSRQTKMHSNTKEATAILEAVTSFGCIAIEQLPYIMPESSIPRENYPTSIINYLISSHQILKDGNTLCSLNCKYEKKEIIDSIWVMIDIVEKHNTEDIHISEIIRNSFMGNKPETIGFILNSKKVIRLIPVFYSADVNQVLFSQEKYYATGHKKGDEKESDLIFYLVIRDKAILQEISKLSLTYPYKVAYLEGEKRPAIKILNPPKVDNRLYA